MIDVLTAFSRIVIILFVAIFTFIDLFLIFERRLGQALGDALIIIQRIVIFLFLGLCTYICWLNLNNPWPIYIFLLAILSFVLIILSLKNVGSSLSAGLVNNVLFFLAMSFVELERLNMDSALRQAIFCLVAILISFGIIILLKRIYQIERFYYIFFIIGIFLLSLVYFLGSREYGAKLSLSFGNISIQPSEFVKISFCFFVCSCIAIFKNIKGLILATIGSVFHILILVMCKDLGTALIYALCYMFISFIAYKNYLLLLVEIGVGIFAGYFAYNNFPHIQRRFLAYTDPLSVAEDQGYQLSQSLFAIGSGSFFGQGLFKGQPKKIPVVTKDFIFASIAEEMGGIVAICLIIVFICSFILIFNLAYRCHNSFYMLVTCCIAIIFAIQTLLNIGGVIKFIPSTGVTLPFISYGGSSLLSMFICFYIAENGEVLNEN
ncbi:MAG: FtsW/RodA/SpoVE family cell cycle protein [Pseudobutyrivibrio sp.]|nr:FtsW/RodA/SpoVE family cell cycle protein [Pseudobutyrivibrio sp.]